MVAIGIDFGMEKVQAAFFDNTCSEPMIIATVNGYGILSEKSILEAFTELKKATGAAEAVIAVPGCLNKRQREMIKNTGESVGYVVKRIIHKSSAAALAYEQSRVQKQRHKDELAAVCTIDRGLIEIAIAEFYEGVVEIQIIDWDNDFDDLSQKRFDELFRKIIEEKENQMIAAALAGDESDTDINFTSDQIDTVIINGSSMRFKTVQSLINNFFKKEIDINKNENLSAIGACIQSAILCGHVKDTVLLDITAKSIGIEILGNVMEIPRFTTIPAKKSEIFSFTKDDQPIGNINVFEGENEIITQNYLLGKLIMSNNAPLFMGITEIEITIDINVNSAIEITVKDIESGKTINTLNI